MAAKPTVAKVSVQCPHCGAHQLEPAQALSTYCRSCSQHFELASAGPAGSLYELEEEDEPGLWEKFSGLFRDNSPKVVTCFACGTRQEVVRTATSSSCKACGAYIDLQDFKIINGFNRAIQTAGNIYVTPKGDLNCAKAVCGMADIRGPMRGHLLCMGEVTVKYKGRITGGIESDSFHVLKRSTVEFVRPIRAREIKIEGDISGRILSTGTVHITKSGRVSGAIFAKGINIERGGVFQGELNIGDNPTEEPSLLPTPQEQKPARPRDNPQSELGLGLN